MTVGVLPEAIELYGFTLCRELRGVERRIEASRRILDLEVDWDEEEDVGYDESTWRMAVGIVVESANAFWQSTHQSVPLPAISPGPDGSIDVTWIVDTRQLLVNVPPPGAGSVTFSGLDSANRDRVVKGRLPSDADNVWLMTWLTT